MKLIGAGFGRTGTKSLKIALEMLGYGPCYHMVEVFDREKNPDHLRIWDELGRGKPVDWQSLFQNYQSTVDWPACTYYRELMTAFPQAKVLLSVRDPERWHESAMSTIFNLHLNRTDIDETFQRMVNNIVFEKTFQQRQTDRDYAISIFLRHIEEVKRDVPPEKLLVYNIREGWEPLCRFLDAPVPEVPFPKENTTEEFQARNLKR